MGLAAGTGAAGDGVNAPTPVGAEPTCGVFNGEASAGPAARLRGNDPAGDVTATGAVDAPLEAAVEPLVPGCADAPVEVVEPPCVWVGVGVFVLVFVGDCVVPVGLGEADGDGEGLSVADGVGVSDGMRSVMSPSSASAAEAPEPRAITSTASNTERNAISRRRGFAMSHAFPGPAAFTRDGDLGCSQAHETGASVPLGSGAAQSSGRWSGMMKSHGSTSKPSCLCRAWQIS